MVVENKTKSDYVSPALGCHPEHIRSTQRKFREGFVLCYDKHRGADELRSTRCGLKE
jgi:hypothetical protein